MEFEQSTESKPARQGTLYIVSTPIGNDDDITLRALKMLKSSDIVICEEAKVGARTLHKYNLSQKMELLNEQNEIEKTKEMLKLLEDGRTLSLISDCGTPLFADPGFLLVQAAIKHDYKVVVIPGVSSIMTAIVRSGFNIDQFLYAGFLSRKNEERILQLRHLSEETRTVVLLETPYRLQTFLEAASRVMPNRKAYLGCNLTMHYETHHYGTFSELYKKFTDMKFKGEFVVCFEAAPSNIMYDGDEVSFAKSSDTRKIIRTTPRKIIEKKVFEKKIIEKRSNDKTDRFRDKDRDKFGRSDKPRRTDRSRKPDKFGKSGGFGKSDRFGKPDKYGKSDKFEKKERFGKTEKKSNPKKIVKK